MPTIVWWAFLLCEPDAVRVFYGVLIQFSSISYS